MSARLRADHSYYRQLYDGEPTSRPLLDMWADVSGEKTHHAAQTITGLAHDLLAAHVNGEGIYSMRFHYWHGGLEMMRKGLWIDQVLGSGALTPDEQARVKAAAVLFANVLWDDDVVPLFEGHGLNLGTANMPVQQQAYRDFYALLLAEHPTLRDRAARDDDGMALRETVSDDCESPPRPIRRSSFVNRGSERITSNTGSALSQISQLSRSSNACSSHSKACSISPSPA